MLPCWRVFFLGSPALHNVGTDRLQMVGVRSLHVDNYAAWALRPPDVVNIVLPPTTLEARHDWDQIQCSTLFLQSISESCNKKNGTVNKMYFVILFHIVLWVQCYIKRRGRPKKEEQRTSRAIER